MGNFVPEIELGIAVRPSFPRRAPSFRVSADLPVFCRCRSTCASARDMVTATRSTTTIVFGRIALPGTAHRSVGQWARYASVFLALAGGAVLLTSAVPRTIAAFSMLQGDLVLDAIQTGQKVRVSDLEDLVSSREAALSWIDSGRVWTDLGLAQQRMVRKVGILSAEGRGLLDESVTSLRRGLALAPANPYAWARLGFVELIRGGPSMAVIEALKISMLTGTHEPHLMYSRLDLLLRVWPHFDEVGRVLVAQQIRIAWSRSRTKVAKLARKWSASEIVVDALDSPEDVRDFGEALKSL